MVTKKIIEVEVCTCDRCRKEIEADHWRIKMNRGLNARELDLCDDCEMSFKAFMMNKPWPPEESETEETTENLEETKETEETIIKSEDSVCVGSLSSDIDFKRSFPGRLRKFMDENNLTQAETATLIGVGSGTISNWLRGMYDGVNCRTQSKLDEFIAEYGL